MLRVFFSLPFMAITHEQQKERWNKEHKTPFALKQMDAKKLSSGIVPFVEDDKKIFLKTIYPSRKLTQKYLGKE